MMSNRIEKVRLVILVTVLACMTASGRLYALSAADDSKTAPQQPAPEEHSPPVKPRPSQSAKPAKPAATFKPSERIGADSAVSFPVDI